MKSFWHKLHFFLLYPQYIRNWYCLFFYRIGFTFLQPSKILLYEKVAFHFNKNFDMLLETWWLHLYDLGIMDFSDSKVIVDIWWHVWFFSIYASIKSPLWKVYVFEPDPQNYEDLVKNITLNKRENIIAYNNAVWSVDEIINFYVSDHSWCNSRYQVSRSNKTIKVNSISFETWMDNNNISMIDFLKVDCEWWEYDILLNMSDIYINKIYKIAWELHNVWNHKPMQIVDKLSNLWWIVYYDSDIFYAINKNI